MNRIRQAGARGMFGAALSLGLAKHPETVYESPVAADLIHDGAEAENEAPPAINRNSDQSTNPQSVRSLCPIFERTRK